ncbi:lactonase family protein [Mesobacillus foraminis]|uniref:lactonase family protein n=1 Tax=Mesobacillus foraminis TaxID=279826 RepID=UPI000EF4C1B9|nr:lactonase family protein [Mesobacillus foraminis]
MKEAKQYRGYIGTYTKGDSEGIYSFILDAEEGIIKNVSVAATLDNPTYLTVTDSNKQLYAVAKEGDEGGVAAYSIGDNGELSKLNSTAEAGSPPCHVSVNTDYGVLSANYHKGTIDFYELNPNGSIQPAASIAKHEGSGPDPRQEKAHSHYAGFTPDGKYVVAVELGIDQVITYKLQGNQLIKVSQLDTRPGSGPRHLAFHPNKEYAYVMTEFSSEVLVLKYNQEDGSFTQQQAISTLPAEFTENNQGSAIHLSSDGKFVYAGNRGHNSIAVFSVDPQTFELTFVEHVSTAGDWPRDFILDPSEKFVVASNQESSNLVLYSRDSETGKLTLLQSDITVPDPVCVKFLNY